MKDSCWIIMSEKGIRRLAKGRKANWHEVQRPPLAAGEYAVLVTLEVAQTAFKPRPLPEATITVTEESLIAAPVKVTIEDPPPVRETDIPEDAVVENHCPGCGEFESECVCD